MNNLLKLSGRFEKRKNDAGFGGVKLPANKKVQASHLEELINQLLNVKKYWINNNDIAGALVSVYYSRVVAKSNRLKCLLGDKGVSPVDSIRGAKFKTEVDKDGKENHKHVFTHYVQISAIDRAISNLENAIIILNNGFNGCITAEDTEKLGKEIPYKYDELAKTTFLNVIVDAHFVEKFDVDISKADVKENTLVTIYKTDIDTKKLMSSLGINIMTSDIIDETTLLLTREQMQVLYNKAPYLISMSVKDFSKLKLEDIVDEDLVFEENNLIPKPTTEPIVGVIDTMFNDEVYFHEWVEFKNMLPSAIEIDKQDMIHGTAVSSIIVDGPKGNSQLDDGCGRFRVRHFGVSKHTGFSSFAVLKNIREIVASNPDIKVWNLSLGSPEQIKDNSISPEAAELDRIQNEYDVIFVVAGTNKPIGDAPEDMKVGSPADSLNAIVVNSVNMNNMPASYSRKGPVLSFFHKPDVSYYGGDGFREEGQITVCVDSSGARHLTGTSFAAPWITRKVAYLIYVMGLSREVAKALIIDSASKWNGNGSVSDYTGYGVVPKRIEDIINTPEDEIKFIITGTTEEYETYNYNLPVPMVNDKHPFYSKAVLVYFPHCDRNQGVDYTSTEMDIHFGRVKTDGSKTRIKSIDDNKQSEEGQIVYEEEARKLYRKWDNVKRVCEQIKDTPRPRKSYDAGMWGISVLTKDRTIAKDRHPLNFGLVITLKEMYGKNRIDDFIKMSIARGWLVNRLDIQNQIDIYNKAEEEIEFE